MRNPRKTEWQCATLATAIALLIGGLGVARSPNEPSQELLLALVDGYAHAIETNNHELAMSYVHPHSPRMLELDAALREQLEWCFERARTTRLDLLPRSGGSVAARVDQDYVRVVGLKFLYGTRQSVYHFRAHGEAYRLWAIDELEPR
jgi:hypothetical protein